MVEGGNCRRLVVVGRRVGIFEKLGIVGFGYPNVGRVSFESRLVSSLVSFYHFIYHHVSLPPGIELNWIGQREQKIETYYLGVEFGKTRLSIAVEDQNGIYHLACSCSCSCPSSSLNIFEDTKVPA